MVDFNGKHVLRFPQLLKIPEFVLALITMIVARNGANGYPPIIGNVNDDIFANMVYYGFFFIIFVQLLGILLGDKSPVQDVLFALCGFIFYLGMGARILDNYGGSASLSGFGPSKGLGSMSIITSVCFLVDTIFSLISLSKED